MSCQLWFRPFVRFYIYKLNERMNGWNCVIESFDTIISILSFKMWYLSFHPFIRSLANSCSTLKKLNGSYSHTSVRSFVRTYGHVWLETGIAGIVLCHWITLPRTYVWTNERTERLSGVAGIVFFVFLVFIFLCRGRCFFNVVPVVWKNCASVPLNSKR